MRRDESIRWTKQKAASEFGLDPKTLTTRLRRVGVEAGKDGCYSTQQICTAVFGDIDGEKLRLTREQADKLAIENAESRRELIRADELLPMLERGLAALRATVYAASNLEREDKDKIINHLRQMWESVAGAVDAGGASVDAPAELHSEPVG